MPTRRTSKGVVTLTTDFGLQDQYVGVMKGVILGIAPGAAIVDLTHDIRAYEITEAAFNLAQAYRYFPKKTVHVAVVDPGVGTSRRPILVEAAGQYFVGPDNGIFSMVLAREPKAKVRAITAGRYFLKPLSQTFHGRDIFAPVGAHLAAGVPPSRFGKLIKDHFKAHPVDRALRTGRRVWTGQVLKVDRFGNLVTNFAIEEFPDLDRRIFRLQAGLEILSRLVWSYQEGGAPGEAFVIPGSSGYYEISCNQDSAAKRLGCASGSPLELQVW